MGNRVLRGTLWAWNNYDLASGVPLLFRNTFLVAADVVNETLHVGHSGELICHASDDLALRASKAANLKNVLPRDGLVTRDLKISIKRRRTYTASIAMM